MDFFLLLPKESFGGLAVAYWDIILFLLLFSCRKIKHNAFALRFLFVIVVEEKKIKSDYHSHIFFHNKRNKNSKSWINKWIVIKWLIIHFQLIAKYFMYLVFSLSFQFHFHFFFSFLWPYAMYIINTWWWWLIVIGNRKWIMENFFVSLFYFIFFLEWSFNSPYCWKFMEVGNLKFILIIHTSFYSLIVIIFFFFLSCTF